jgi:hypothetical protein
MILALARPDPKKNIPTLVKAFGECKPLRKLANMVGKSSIYLHLLQLYNIIDAEYPMTVLFF